MVPVLTENTQGVTVKFKQVAKHCRRIGSRRLFHKLGALTSASVVALTSASTHLRYFEVELAHSQVQKNALVVAPTLFHKTAKHHLMHSRECIT